MKINQLFTRPVPVELLSRLVTSMGLDGIQDSRNFTKYDLVRVNAVANFQSSLQAELETYYLPCKARLYLANMTEKKLVTVAKQVLRLHGHCVVAKERNFGNKKVIVYRVLSTRAAGQTMQQSMSNVCISFD